MRTKSLNQIFALINLCGRINHTYGARRGPDYAEIQRACHQPKSCWPFMANRREIGDNLFVKSRWSAEAMATVFEVAFAD